MFDFGEASDRRGARYRRIALISIFIAALLCAASVASAGQDRDTERYLEMLRSKDHAQISRAAQGMYKTGNFDLEATDVMAELLLKGYDQKIGCKPCMQAMSWIAKALGAAGNARYRTVLETATESPNRSVKKYAKKALTYLPEDDTPQYKPGSAKMEQAPKKAAPKRKRTGKHPFDKIEEGMAMGHVYSLIGPPTSESSHMTGKQFIPRWGRYSGRADTYRVTAHYEGRGRIVFSNPSSYSGRVEPVVKEIIYDDSEPGHN
jgi:hypothetical protein